MPDASRPGRAPTEELPRFVSGSTMRHVAVMTATGSIGLVAVFAVDLLSLLYISWLGDPALTAGVGLATIVNFFAIHQCRADDRDGRAGLPRARRPRAR